MKHSDYLRSLAERLRSATHIDDDDEDRIKDAAASLDELADACKLADKFICDTFISGPWGQVVSGLMDAVATSETK